MGSSIHLEALLTDGLWCLQEGRVQAEQSLWGGTSYQLRAGGSGRQLPPQKGIQKAQVHESREKVQGRMGGLDSL